MPTKSSFSKKHPLAFSLLCLLVAGIFVALININFVNNITDGTEKYSGVELTVAKLALDNFDNFDDGIGTHLYLSKLQVREVAYTPKDKCSDRKSEYSYSYTLESTSWFGIKVNKKTDSICRLFGG